MYRVFDRFETQNPKKTTKPKIKTKGNKTITRIWGIKLSK